MIRIINQRVSKYNPDIPYHVKIDRSSVLGNPYKISDYGSRDLVCDMYNDRLVKILNDHYNGIETEDSNKILNEITRLVKIHESYGMINLYCWCDTDTQRCHGDILVDILEKLVNT